MPNNTNGLFGTAQAAPSINPVPIQPGPLPGSTFVRPQQVAAGGNAEALARSLSGLSQALQNYANVKDQQSRNPDNRENKAFLDSLPGKSVADLQLMAQNGE
ncbi:hypothetical protein [Jiella pacifica]|uniref:Uncharacterized protein n=1 Tax=Jiella pacifica TaxID=2696469 RepID=A0A6N9T182_9HYPH|nr:hypothetical protein [Jiella pacifica]NDW03955.1 hypothetical protein [Jiella pacifica]